MIERQELDIMAKKLEVPPAHVEKDYVHGWLLSQLYSSSALANRLVLKGGNCLRKGYFEYARYSSDLDFSTPVSIDAEELLRELNATCERVTARTGVVFDTSKTRVAGKKTVDQDKKVAEARLYFRDFYGKESEVVLAVKLDVTQFDRLYLPVQSRMLIHPYSDSQECQTPIRCVKLEEVLATKMRCLLQRKHIADLFDLVYASIIEPKIDINRLELITTFFKITIFGRSPAVAKGLFLDLPMEALGRVWSQYIFCPNVSWFDFERAKETFLQLIHALIPGNAEHNYSPMFFPSSVRNPILEAADSQVLLRLRYHNVERLVEPYELVFKIRKDGIGHEYFYAYDTTGGRSSPPSLKSFLPGDVQSVEVTEVLFKPRYEIKTSKSGGVETISRFYGNRRFSLRGLLSTPRQSRSSRGAAWTPYTVYVVQCPVCNKRFRRHTRDTKLNKHKNSYGGICPGRTGYIV